MRHGSSVGLKSFLARQTLPIGVYIMQHWWYFQYQLVQGYMGSIYLLPRVFLPGTLHRKRLRLLQYMYRGLSCNCGAQPSELRRLQAMSQGTLGRNQGPLLTLVYGMHVHYIRSPNLGPTLVSEPEAIDPVVDSRARCPKNRINIRILYYGPKAQDIGDSRKHGAYPSLSSEVKPNEDGLIS